MFKTLFFVAIIATVRCLDVKEKLKEDPVIKYQPPFEQQGQRVDGFRPRSDWSYYFPSWSNYFHEDDDVDESSSLLKRLAALEKEVKELNDLLKKESTGVKNSESPTTPSNKEAAASQPCKDSAAKTPKDKMPEKTEKKPVQEKKPTEPEETAVTHEAVTKSKETMEKSEEPVKDGEATHDEEPSEDGSSRKGNDEEPAP